MSTHLKPFSPPSEESTARRRAPWRQRLVEAERGVALGLRADSTFFIHFFVSTVVIGAALVLGFSYIEWTVTVLALTLVLSAEMFNQVLKTLLNSAGRYLGDDMRTAQRMGTAAVFFAMTGALFTVVVVFGHHVLEMFAE